MLEKLSVMSGSLVGLVGAHMLEVKFRSNSFGFWSECDRQTRAPDQKRLVDAWAVSVSFSTLIHCFRGWTGSSPTPPIKEWKPRWKFLGLSLIICPTQRIPLWASLNEGKQRNDDWQVLLCFRLDFLSLFNKKSPTQHVKSCHKPFLLQMKMRSSESRKDVLGFV